MRGLTVLNVHFVSPSDIGPSTTNKDAGSPLGRVKRDSAAGIHRGVNKRCEIRGFEVRFEKGKARAAVLEREMVVVRSKERKAKQKHFSSLVRRNLSRDSSR